MCCLPRNAGGLDDIIPAPLFEKGRFCFPLKQSAFDYTGSDYGSGRPVSAGANYKKRCHSGQDIFSKGAGEVVAIDDGEVVSIIPTFLNCKRGVAGAVLVYHPSIGRTMNYGEIAVATLSRLGVKVGSRVKRGSPLGIATACGMLHFEVYNGRQADNLRWWPTKECKQAEANGRIFQCAAAPFKEEKNMCAKYAIDLKNPTNLDPRPYIDLLMPGTGQGAWC